MQCTFFSVFFYTSVWRNDGGSELFIYFTVNEDSSLKKSELINWYLKEMESEIETEAQLIAKKSLIEKVLHRLIHYVRVIL